MGNLEVCGPTKLVILSITMNQHFGNLIILTKTQAVLAVLAVLKTALLSLDPLETAMLGIAILD